VLFVTHAVDEAVYLADRVLLMTSAPGQIKADIPINLPRPRQRDELLRDPRYQNYVIEISHLMDRPTAG
jgi:NitT/TauT family transport system ATP-binding protein